jgi:tryptophan synthase beta chain
VAVTDREALDAFRFLAQNEGILPALETSHAVAFARKLAPRMSSRSILIINLSGRGDKDVNTVLEQMGSNPKGGKK